jgi:hypothetical protein
MSSLSTLKLVSAQKPQKVAPLIVRRQNLSQSFFHQIELAKAFNENRQYIPTRIKSIKDKLTGERKSIETEIKVKPTWFTIENKVFIQIKYANKVLELAKGKNSVEVNSSNELISVLVLLKKAIDEGALDSQIELASKSLRERFSK